MVIRENPAKSRSLGKNPPKQTIYVVQLSNCRRHCEPTCLLSCYPSYTYFQPLDFRYTVPLRSCFPEWRGSSLLHASGDRSGFPVLQYSQEQDLINKFGLLG
jgi:hypothetical protein